MEGPHALGQLRGWKRCEDNVDHRLSMLRSLLSPCFRAVKREITSEKKKHKSPQSLQAPTQGQSQVSTQICTGAGIGTPQSYADLLLCWGRERQCFPLPPRGRNCPTVHGQREYRQPLILKARMIYWKEKQGGKYHRVVSDYFKSWDFKFSDLLHLILFMKSDCE